MSVNGIWINYNWKLYMIKLVQILFFCENESTNKSKLCKCLSDLVLFLAVCSTYSTAFTVQESQ